ncbi:hypothetical protein ACFLS9_10570 [Bacteroidota bacterium]
MECYIKHIAIMFSLLFFVAGCDNFDSVVEPEFSSQSNFSSSPDLLNKEVQSKNGSSKGSTQTWFTKKLTLFGEKEGKVEFRKQWWENGIEFRAAINIPENTFEDKLELFIKFDYSDLSINIQSNHSAFNKLITLDLEISGIVLEDFNEVQLTYSDQSLQYNKSFKKSELVIDNESKLIGIYEVVLPSLIRSRFGFIR